MGDAKRIGDIALLPRMGRVTIDVRPSDASVSLVSGSERIEYLQSGRPLQLDLSRHWTFVAERDGFQTLRQVIEWNGAFERTLAVTLERITLALMRK
jgi:hypothetical protein